jgi:hypothetical protein
MCDLWDRLDQADGNRNQGKLSPGATPSQGVGGDSIAPPRGREDQSIL